jgi:hypothetical protein
MEGWALAGAGTGKSMVALGHSGCRRAATMLSKLCTEEWALAGAGTGMGNCAIQVVYRGTGTCWGRDWEEHGCFGALAVEDWQPCYPSCVWKDRHLLGQGLERAWLLWGNGCRRWATVLSKLCTEGREAPKSCCKKLSKVAARSLQKWPQEAPKVDARSL